MQITICENDARVHLDENVDVFCMAWPTLSQIGGLFSALTVCGLRAILFHHSMLIDLVEV